MILNLTQHPATPEQIAQGVRNVGPGALAALREALTFDAAPTVDELRNRAVAVAAIAVANCIGGDDEDDPLPRAAMIGGAGYFMPALEAALRGCGIEPLHAFTVRDVVETVSESGAVVKTAVFRHSGWVRTE